MHKLEETAIDLLFREARTHRDWQSRPVPAATLRELYDLTRYGPTSANCCPLRLVFVTTPAAKDRLRPHLDEGNVESTDAAPVTAILAFDTLFYDHMDKLSPHKPSVREWWVGEEKTGNETAFRNSSLQGGYFIMAARSLGLDCGPMSGFDKAGVDAEFFPDRPFKSNFLCNLGFGTGKKLHPRAPRFEFDEVCEIL